MRYALLFVQTGDGRPTRRKNFSAHRQDAGWLRYAIDYASNVACDCWWLVECENARAGRIAIAKFVDFRSALPWKLPRVFGPGRILACGAKQTGGDA